MKPIISYLRSRSLLSVVYLDDFICWGDSYSHYYTNTYTTITLLTSLGFLINSDKSMLIPSTSCKYLGFIINSKALTLCLTDQKKESLLHQLKSIKLKKSFPIRTWARLIESLVTACPGVEYSPLHCKKLERAKTMNLRKNNNNFNHHMSLPNFVHSDLDWWIDRIPTAYRKIRCESFCQVIFSDASRTGWRAFCNKESAHGLWTTEEQQLHINILELKAAFIALKCFAKDLSHCEILLKIDNSTALVYINKMGGTQFPHLHALAEEFWNWCELRNIWVRATYISSRDNVEADYQSRITNIDTEWSLAPYAYSLITQEFGLPDIDLFASRLNAKPHYIVRGRETQMHLRLMHLPFPGRT